MGISANRKRLYDDLTRTKHDAADTSLSLFLSHASSLSTSIRAITKIDGAALPLQPYLPQMSVLHRLILPDNEFLPPDLHFANFKTGKWPRWTLSCLLRLLPFTHETSTQPNFFSKSTDFSPASHSPVRSEIIPYCRASNVFYQPCLSFADTLDAHSWTLKR